MSAPPPSPAPGLPPEDREPRPPEAAGELLDQLLGSLLGDFRFWFARGQLLLTLCPDRVMGPAERRQLAEELDTAQRQLVAASSLRQATPAPMALAMDTLTPWHQLMLKVWNLSAALRLAGVALPDLEGRAEPQTGP